MKLVVAEDSCYAFPWSLHPWGVGHGTSGALVGSGGEIQGHSLRSG